jgi:hypothetical protein
VEAQILLNQLSELGKQLDRETSKLGELDLLATGKGIEYQHVRESYEDDVASAFMAADGSVEAKKNEARLKCVSMRLYAQEISGEWEKLKAQVRTQQAIVRAVNTRIDIGRSLLSHEKAMMTL